MRFKNIYAVKGAAVDPGTQSQLLFQALFSSIRLFNTIALKTSKASNVSWDYILCTASVEFIHSLICTSFKNRNPYR